MELCYSCTTTTTTTTPTFLQLKPSLVSLSLSNTLLQLNTSKNNTLFIPRKLSSSSRQFSLLQPQSSRLSTRFAASSSSTAYDTVQDQLPADIEVTETQEPNSRIRLSVEVPPAVCEDCYKRVMNEFMKQSKVPGFRPGKKVPESILLSYVGKQNARKATIESVLKRTLPHAMSSVTGRALKDSIRIVTKFSDMEETYSSLNSLRYDIIVDVAPEVKWIPEGGYKNLKIVVQIDSEIDAHKASEQELKRRHKSLGLLRIVTDRGLQIGDVVVLDISATTIDQDESNIRKIPSAETKGFNFDTEDGDKVLPGFLDSIIGIQQGETKSFPLVFPESWKQENLRGVHAQFTVECKELFYRDLPELDDSIADKLLPGCTTLEQVKESLLQKCLEVEQTAKEQATDNAILDQLRKMIEVDIPQSLLEEQGRQFYGAKLLEIQANMNAPPQEDPHRSSPPPHYRFVEMSSTAAGEIMLFGVRVKVDPMRKSVSMNNLSQYEQPQCQDSSNVADVACGGGGYASADEAVHPQSSGSRERKRGVPWTEDEHKLFLLGLQRVGKGDWRGISRNFVKTRTPTQVASHAQKYFLRRSNLNRRRRRSSLFDITTESVTAIPMEEENLHHPPLESTNIGGSQVVPFPVTVGSVLLPVQIENPMEKLTLGHIDQSNPIPVLLFSNASSTMVDSNLNQKSTVDPSPLSLKLSLSSDQNQSSMRSAFQVMSSINNGDNIISVA